MAPLEIAYSGKWKAESSDTTPRTKLLRPQSAATRPEPGPKGPLRCFGTPLSRNRWAGRPFSFSVTKPKASCEIPKKVTNNPLGTRVTVFHTSDMHNKLTPFAPSLFAISRSRIPGV